MGGRSWVIPLKMPDSQPNGNRPNAVLRIRGRDRQKTMTLPVAEFIRRFLIHVLPSGFHRIRHYGLLASGARAHNIARVRQLLTPAAQSNPNDAADDPGEPDPPKPYPRPCCGGRMIVAEKPRDQQGPRERPPSHM